MGKKPEKLELEMTDIPEEEIEKMADAFWANQKIENRKRLSSGAFLILLGIFASYVVILLGSK